jgi:hypothetical protein
VLYPVTSTASLASRAGRIANRNLSWGEWQRYVGTEVPYYRVNCNLPDGDGVPEAVKAGLATRSDQPCPRIP